MLEEAAMDIIPAIAIEPMGDVSNLKLETEPLKPTRADAKVPCAALLWVSSGAQAPSVGS